MTRTISRAIDKFIWTEEDVVFEDAVRSGILDAIDVQTLAFNPNQPRDEQGQWTTGGNQWAEGNFGVTVYHGTLEDRVASIQKSGLLADGNGLVFSTDNRALAEKYAQMKARQRGGKGTPIVVQLSIPDDVVAKMSVEFDGFVGEGGEGIFKHEGNIPASWIVAVHPVGKK